MNAPSTRRWVRMPASTAASGLEPIAYSSRPMRARPSTVPTRIITAIVISGRTGKPAIRAVPRSRKLSGMSAALICRPCAHA